MKDLPSTSETQSLIKWNEFWDLSSFPWGISVYITQSRHLIHHGWCGFCSEEDLGLGSMGLDHKSPPKEEQLSEVKMQHSEERALICFFLNKWSIFLYVRFFKIEGLRCNMGKTRGKRKDTIVHKMIGIQMLKNVRSEEQSWTSRYLISVMLNDVCVFPRK